MPVSLLATVLDHTAVFDKESLQFENKLKDYNFGTLVRKDASRLYGQDNSVLVTRVQFFAIEVSVRSRPRRHQADPVGRLPGIEQG